MTDTTSYVTPEWVASLREQQGLPPHVENPTTLERIATLLRTPDLGGST